MRKLWRASSALLFWDLQDTTEALDMAFAALALVSSLRLKPRSQTPIYHSLVDGVWAPDLAAD